MVRTNDIIILIKDSDHGRKGDLLNVIAHGVPVFLAKDKQGDNIKFKQSDMGLEFMVDTVAEIQTHEDEDDGCEVVTINDMPAGLNLKMWGLK